MQYCCEKSIFANQFYLQSRRKQFIKNN